VLVALDDPRGIPVTEEMAFPTMALVESEGVDAVEPVDAARELLDIGMQDEVVVRGHQAEGVDRPPESVDAVGEETEEVQTVGVVPKDRATVHAPRRHVKDAVRELRPQLPRHASKLSPQCRNGRHRGTFVTQSLRGTRRLSPTSRVRPC
jgi:hypothetical protein